MSDFRKLPENAVVGLYLALDDVSGLSDAEVLEELRDAGIDLGVATRKLDKALMRVSNARRREALDRAKAERLARPRVDRLAEIQRRRLPMDVLRAEVASRGGVAAHRELDAVERVDLESQLADLMDLEDGS